MKRTPIQLSPEQIPAEFHALLRDAPVFDSSCSPEARVYYIEKDRGYFLKTAAKGSLEKEAQMTRYFHKKGLSAPVLAYRSEGADWLLTERVPGEDCTQERYLSDPKRLCEILGQLLRRLHETDPSGCPAPDRMESYLATAARNYRAGKFDAAFFSQGRQVSSAQDAWAMVEANAKYLKSDTLLHGDYCLPNVLLDAWRFSGFIDLDCAGVGDRHIDLFWGAWTLRFNLKTDAYTARFLDAYGRQDVEPEKLALIAAIEAFG